MNIPDWVIICGLVLGSLAVISACWVWVAHRQFGSGGSVLSAVGVVLVGLSIWKNVEVRAGVDGVEWKFEQLEQRVAAAEERAAEAEVAATEAAEQGTKAFQQAALASESLSELTGRLQSQAILDPEAVESIRDHLRARDLQRMEDGQRRR